MQSRLFVYWFNQEPNSVVFIDCFDEAWDVVNSPLIGDADETIIISLYGRAPYEFQELF